jgi:microcystin-dependent protein
MSSPFVAEIKIFAGNFAPTGYATCDGQLLPISQNTALFSLLGTYYGGDGKSTFALPDLQGTVPVGAGQGSGLQEWFLGQQQGSETVTLLESEMPAHNHNVNAKSTAAGGVLTASGNSLALGTWIQGAQFGVIQQYSTSNAPVAQMAFNALTPAGGSLPHNNMMPYLTMTYLIALQGIFPPRT